MPFDNWPEQERAPELAITGDFEKGCYRNRFSYSGTGRNEFRQRN
ncbi:MAG: hypothetical protein Q7U51_14235 [Methanoregula sp.]|nr:hypothetical protein [Methanoregula sp.]